MAKKTEPKPPGRPKTPEMLKRGNRVVVYLTDLELKHCLAIAGHERLSSFARRGVLRAAGL